MSSPSTNPLAYLFTPGVIVHETGHLAGALATRTKIGKVVLFPKKGRAGGEVNPKDKVGGYKCSSITLLGSTFNLVVAILAIYIMYVLPILALPLCYLALVNLYCCWLGATPLVDGDGFNFLCEIYLLRFPKKIRRCFIRPVATLEADWGKYYKKAIRQRKEMLKEAEEERSPRIARIGRFLAIPFFSIWFLALNFLAVGLVPVVFIVPCISLS